MGRRAEAAGFAQEASTAARIQAAVEAAQAESPPPAACYPRLIWVDSDLSAR
jgi:hypothetical protein